jgi:hypothetical protein
VGFFATKPFTDTNDELEVKLMNKLISALLVAAVVLPVSMQARADKPGVAAEEAVEAVVVVRGVNHKARTVTLQGPRGKMMTMQVPPQAQNLDQVYAGAKFRVRYLRSLAVFISPVGGKPSADEASTMELAEKGATPGGVVVSVKQIQARVEEIDYNARTIVLKGPKGNLVDLAVDERVKRLNEVKKGDIVVVRYTEALAMKMIKQ